MIGKKQRKHSGPVRRKVFQTDMTGKKHVDLFSSNTNTKDPVKNN